jgi:hypothetical protein
MEIMGHFSAAGFKKVTLVAQMPQNKVSAKPNTASKDQKLSKNNVQPKR